MIHIHTTCLQLESLLTTTIYTLELLLLIHMTPDCSYWIVHRDQVTFSCMVITVFLQKGEQLLPLYIISVMSQTTTSPPPAESPLSDNNEMI